MKTRHTVMLAALCGLFLLTALFYRPLLRIAQTAVLMMKGKATVSEQVERYGPAVRQRMAGDFERIGVAWPGRAMTLVGLKAEKRLEVWIAGENGSFQFLRTYPILKASGQAGPKLREGDRQVPEGLYRIESLNPNSRFHLSLRLNYPNAFDRRMAARDGRDDPGSDIMIHGARVSIGCLAMGDPAAEDLFVLAAAIGPDDIEVILSPADFRDPSVAVDTDEMPRWVDGLYDEIRGQMKRFTDE